MSPQPLALKYRPATFGDVISQEHVTRTLQNALHSGRIAHAYLFAGPRGSGKTTTARLLAKALNCDRGVSGEPCGECANCTAIASGRSLDVIEIDAASNRGIDDIKALREAVKYAPAQGRYKVYIVDEVHQLSKDAFNALLKTLEEPPRSVVFVLATTEPHKIPATILSRCQRFDFRPIPLPAIRERLSAIAEREEIRLDEAAGFAIAKKADGSLRDALSLLDQLVAFGGEAVDLDQLRRLIGMPDEERYLDLTRLLAAGDAARAPGFVNELRAAGYDLEEFYSGFLEHLRDCLLFALGTGDALAEVPERYHAAYRETADALGAEDLLRMLTLATDEEQVFRRSSQQALVIQVLLVRLALLDRAVELAPLLAALEGGAGGSGGAAVPSSVPSGRRAGRPSPVAPEPAGELGLELLIGHWDEIVDAVHAERPTVAALLRGARPSRCTPEEIALAVPPGADFRREQLGLKGMLDPLTGVLGRRWGYAGVIRVEKPDPVPQGAAEGPAAAHSMRASEGRPNGRELARRAVESRLEQDPLLRQIVDLFDASVVRVQPSSPA
ncbi:MAG TPA: DNA polymerase III subunit gamma/tau [Gemmatimonadota bacterium]|nr:DNA polymerase III subunit gamma/tau [Gemmatimonadota bacterium]